MPLKHPAQKRIGVVSVMHSLIDFLCAFSVFGLYRFRSDPFQVFLIYNFCAFAMQLPLGILLDAYMDRKRETRELLPFLALTLGAFLTAAGCFGGVITLGLGNALFHSGAGILSIMEDDASGMHGAGLGVFVAPGAIGLYLGTVLQSAARVPLVAVVSAVLAICVLLLYRSLSCCPQPLPSVPEKEPFAGRALIALALCFGVVVIRSSVGFAVSFSWKTGFLLSFLSVIALASGKAAGGFAAAHFGMRKTVVVSLLVSAAAFCRKDFLPAGMLALFAFNMTMPLTLYLLSRRF